MYEILTGIVVFLLFCLAVVAVLYLRKWWQDGQPDRDHGNMKSRLSSVRLDNEEPRDMQELAKENLRFANVPDFDAGDMLYDVPCINPDDEGKWMADQTIITTSRIGQLTKDGVVNLELFELAANGYVVLVKGPKVFVLKRYNMTTAQQQRLIQERKDACDRGDGKIAEFLGKPWTIVMATGDLDGGFSTIQMLSAHQRLGEEGFLSVLPPELLDSKAHHYYDLEAVSDNDVLVAFYCKGGWVCLIGRQMSVDEVKKMHG